MKYMRKISTMFFQKHYLLLSAIFLFSISKAIDSQYSHGMLLLSICLGGLWLCQYIVILGIYWKRFVIWRIGIVMMTVACVCLSIVVGVGAFSSLYNAYHVQIGWLYDDAKQIDKAVKAVEKNHKDEIISIINKCPNTALVISPPYCSFEGLGFSQEAVNELAHEAMVHETGHLFVVGDKGVLYHELLTAYAEPILSVSRERIVSVRVTEKQTSGRPVTIEFVQ